MIYFLRDGNNLLDYAEYKFNENCLQDDRYSINYIDKNRHKFKVYENTLVDISDTPEFLAQELAEEKKIIILWHDKIRDERISKGVLYKNMRFEIDADNKINLFIFSQQLINDDDCLDWSSADNEPVRLSKIELTKLAGLISELTSKIWSPSGMNTYYKNQIDTASNLAALNSISLDDIQNAYNSL